MQARKEKLNRRKKWLIPGAAVGWVYLILWGAGCAGPGAAQNPIAPVAQTPSARHEAEAGNRNGLYAPASAEGSLWQDNGSLGMMFANAKARNVGDIVTVRIVETASAKNKATTKTGRTSNITGGLTNFFNMEQGYPADRPFFNPFSSVAASLDSQFDGTGSTERTGALNAYMTARIVEILPNGNLYIQGNREVRVNNENQIITLTGLVRPRDISADNVVQSTYIADARIAYSGTGIVNDRQRPGWLMRILDIVWPF